MTDKEIEQRICESKLEMIDFMINDKELLTEELEKSIKKIKDTALYGETKDSVLLSILSVRVSNEVSKLSLLKLRKDILKELKEIVSNFY